MLNIRTKHIVLISDVICLNKTHGEYVSKRETTKETSYIRQDEDDYDKWDYVKMDPVNTEINDEDVKLNKTLQLSSILWEKKTYRRLSISFLPQNKKIKLNRIIKNK